MAAGEMSLGELRRADGEDGYSVRAGVTVCSQQGRGVQGSTRGGLRRAL